MKQVYDYLESINAHWGRKDDNHIYVWTSGYVTQDCHDIERQLLKSKVRAVKQEYDKVCGKTITVYKHK